jgi:uncharacterized membrane protein YhaH (DUF805 family)
VSALVETLVTALVLSALAGGLLVLLPNAPPRARFAVAIAGLAAWLVPWGLIRIPLAAPSAVDAPWRASLERIADLGGVAGGIGLDSALLGYAVAATFLLGLALFAGDWLALQLCIRRWRANSRSANELRAQLPPELSAVPAEIRVVRGSNVAAASGWPKSTVWIGDRYSGARLQLTLVHEMWHVRGRDPLWLMAIAAVRRAYWWNPLVAYLTRQAILMIESTCDHRCTAHFGKSLYVAELAALLLDDALPAPRLIATARSPSLNIQRLRLLDRPLRLRARDFALIAASTAIGTAAGAASVVEVLRSESLRIEHVTGSRVLDDLRAVEAEEPVQADP